MKTNLNKLWTIKKTLDNEEVREIKEVHKTVGGKVQLMLIDKEGKLIGFTRFYDEQKIMKKVSRWLFKDFPKEL